MSLFGKRQPNALAAYAFPQTTVDEELRNLINRFGADVVRETSVRLTKKKRGRKQERDWQVIGPKFIRQDATDWLDGRDPFELRSNYSIAVEFAKENPGHNPQATHRRIMGKLAKKRRMFFMLSAIEICRHERPYLDYFRAFAAFPFSSAIAIGQSLQLEHNRYVGAVQNYREKIGEPDSSLTLFDIEMALQQSLLANAALPKGGLLGLLGQIPKPIGE